MGYLWRTRQDGAIEVAVDPSRRVVQLGLGPRALALSRREQQRGAGEQPPGSNAGPDVARYFSGCVRSGAPLGITSGDWCAAGASWAAWRSVRSGEIVPHLWRAAVSEIRADALDSGAWVPADVARSGDWSPRPGDLAVWIREADGWRGHVARVTDVEPSRFVTLGANEQSTWSYTSRSWGEPTLRGFVDYHTRPRLDVITHDLAHPATRARLAQVARWAPAARAAARASGVPLHWLLGCVWAESGGDPHTETADGGVGLMGLTSFAARGGLTREQLLDGPTNLMQGARFWGGILRRGRLDAPEAFSAFNAGVDAHGQPHTGSGPWGLRETPGHIERAVRATNTLWEQGYRDKPPALPWIVLTAAVAALWMRRRRGAE